MKNIINMILMLIAGTTSITYMITGYFFNVAVIFTLWLIVNLILNTPNPTNKNKAK